MFRMAVTLLVSLPLLLPQGVCVCDFLVKCEGCIEAAPSARVVETISTCKCCKHRKTEPPAHAAVIGKQHTCHKSAPLNGKDNHSPCCPAKAGTGEWKCEPGSPQSSPCFAYCGPVTLLTPPLAEVANSIAAPDHFAHGPPVYLAILNLRI